MFKRLITIIALCLAFLSAWAKMKPLTFDNPGNRRLLKTETDSYYYFRAKPEKSMTLNVEGKSAIELRSFAIAKLNKPKVISIIGKQSTTYDLVLQERLEGFYLYQPVAIPIPKGTKSIEILCYDRSVYFRPFFTVPVKPAKPAKLPNLQMKAHGGLLRVTHNSTGSDYYVFNPSQSLKFDLNNGRDAVVYVRARLLDRSLPVFELWRNGQKLQDHEFSLRRTTKYKATGIDHLSTGLKLVLPPNEGTASYELRAVSDHLFIAKPLLLKRK